MLLPNGTNASNTNGDDPHSTRLDLVPWVVAIEKDFW